MMLLAYAGLLVVAAFLIRGRASRLSRRSERSARLLGMTGAIVTASIAIGLIATNNPTSLGLLIVLMLLTVSALAIPSTLTLLLPFAALLALTLRSAPAGRTVAAR